ncbi:hypothetical protein TeGR_g8411 [Tetraparma gracilis]|uniref:Ankyrin repeat domain-containing protein n=2 Tax=Tetraparma gracilis TaxID=2962635 RepID=A0ABQ6MXI0_9STRA|nr:hypothetical protein TeGR_g8411 [Tetraparma gracilis]
MVDAAKEGDTKMVRELLAAGADVNHTKEGDEATTALYKAAARGHLEAAQALIDAGADVEKGRTDDGDTPLQVAYRKNKKSVVEYLKSVGAQMGLDALVDAAEKGDAKKVRELLAAGADVNHTKEGNDGMTALFKAARAGHLEVVKALVGAKANVNKPADNGFTPLKWATARKHTPVVEYLKSVGAHE